MSRSWSTVLQGLLLIGLVFLICFSIAYVNTDVVGRAVHLHNLIGIFLVVLALQVARWWLESSETEFAGRSPVRKGALDIIGNTIIAAACYVGTFHLNRALTTVGAILAMWNLVRLVKYRIYDDIYLHRIHESKSPWLVVPGDAGHTLLRSLLDQLPRAYLYTAFSFTTFQLLLMKDALYGPNSVSHDAFQVTTPSGNPFVDFFYFNIVTISTVGYGDISPLSSSAKMLCAGEMLFSLIVLAALLTTLLGRFLRIADQSSGK